MIDDKKIEEAARYYCNNRYPASQDAPFIAEGFRHGAKWAINELFKIVKIEKGLFLIEHRSTPDGTWQEVKDKQFKTKPKAESWARKNLV